MRVLLFMLLASCATTAGSKAGAPEVELRFARPETLRLEVSRVETVAVSSEPGGTPTPKAATFTETTVRRAPASYVITRGPQKTPDPPPELVVDERGAVQAVENIDGPVAKLSAHFGSPERAREQIEKPMRDDWALTVGAWSGLRLRLGEERQESEPTRFFMKGQLPQRVTTTFVAWVPCVEGAAEARCVKLRARALTPDEVPAELLAELTRRSGRGEFLGVKGEVVVELVTDPNTLIPVSKVMTKTVTVRLRSEGEVTEGSTVTTLSESFKAR